MQKYLLSTVISCAALLLARTANARSYDGSWSLVFFTQRGACDTYNFSVNINDGVVTHLVFGTHRPMLLEFDSLRQSRPIDSEG
jgi:hypothetical protein